MQDQPPIEEIPADWTPGAAPMSDFDAAID